MVIPYLSEKWDHMQATVLSILHFTPEELIEQIIFVSDGNKNPRKEQLEALSPKLQVLVLPKRAGLIRAKMRGAELATAPIIVFMEPHCVVNRRWLEPLIDHVMDNPQTMAMPVLDAISQSNFADYQRAALGHFRLEWNFNLIYVHPHGETDSPEPFPSPATSGGILAMRRDWFEHLELFDTGLRQWGGDQVELTMKGWRCGDNSRIMIIPCSRVGHMFRDADNQPYPVKVDMVVKNYARVAATWTDNHLSTFFKVKPEAQYINIGDVSSLLDQRESLGCRDMDWYLRNVDFEMGWESSRVCIPGADVLENNGCSGDAAPARSTIDQIMPTETYLRAKALSARGEDAGEIFEESDLGGILEDEDEDEDDEEL